MYSIDYNHYNIENARNNAKINDIKNIHFINKKIEDFIDHRDTHNNIVVVLNPPRKGAHKSVMEFINKSTNIKQLIYVSCNVNTLKRDLDLLDIDSKNIRSIQPIDQFPNCNHCEVIVDIIF